MRYLLLTLLLMLSYTLLPQCDLKITGQVIDLDDGKELNDCVVSISGKTVTLFTDAHGRFAITDLCAGIHTILIRHFGCRDTSVSLNLSKTTHLKIKLPHSAFELSEVNIMDKRVEMKQTQIRTDLTGEELDKTRGQTLGEALKNISGVTSLNTGGTISKPMIHGMQGYRILIINNGVRHEGQQWGNEHAPEVDPFIATRLSVIKGANSVRYGSDAIGGVVLVEPNDLPDTNGVTGLFNMIGASNGRSGVASGIIQGKIEKMKHFSWRVQGTVKKAGDLKTPTYYMLNTGVEEYNYSGAIAYHRENWGTDIYYSQFNTKVGIFSSAHIGNLTDLKAAMQLQKPVDSLSQFSYNIGRPFQQIAHELVKSKTHIHVSNKWRLNLQYAYQYNKRQEYDKHKPLNDSLAALNLPELDYRIQSQTAEVVMEHDNIRSFRGQFGGSFAHNFNNYYGRFFIPNYISQSWGLFATERYVKQHFELEGGIRFDKKNLRSYFYRNNQLYTPELNFENISWSLGSIYKPTNDFNLFINVGSAWRAPAPNELYSNGIHHGVGAIERGKEDLKTEQVLNASISGIYNSSNLLFEATAYHNHFDNFIYMNPSQYPELTIKGAFPVFEYEQAKARISGLDVKASINALKHFQISAKAMLLRAWNYTINDYLIYMPSDRYQLDVRYNYKIANSNMFISTNYQFVTKQWRVPSNTDYMLPPSEYGLLGFELGGNIVFGKQEVQLTLSSTNMLNEVYRDYLDRFRYYTDSPGRNILLKLKMPLVIYKPKNKNQ